MTDLNFDTFVDGPGSTVGSRLSGTPMGGMACVSNMGSWANMTGHVLAASNTFGCGRLAWDPTLTASEINKEWAAMTFTDTRSTAQVHKESVRRNLSGAICQAISSLFESSSGFIERESKWLNNLPTRLFSDRLLVAAGIRTRSSRPLRPSSIGLGMLLRVTLRRWASVLCAPAVAAGRQISAALRRLKALGRCDLTLSDSRVTNCWSDSTILSRF